MKRSFLRLLLLSLLALSITGCGSRQVTSSNSKDTPSNSISGSRSTAGVGELGPNIVGTGTINPMTAPGDVRSFLEENHIANGDIYVKEGKVFINIVGLNDETSRLLADQYKTGTYQTVDVAHSIQELEAAQQKLTDLDLYSKLNLYGSSLDVIKNRIIIMMPDTSEVEAKSEIEKLVNPDLLAYDIQKASEKPEYNGTIVKIDSLNHRILILVDGEKEPSIYFSFNEHSEMVSTNGLLITFDDLKVKQEVHLWSTGTINESMPAQAMARKLELVVPKG